MEKLIEILEELQPEVDYKTCEDLIDGHYLDSLTILSLVAEIEDEFDVKIDADLAEGITTVGEAVELLKKARKEA